MVSKFKTAQQLCTQDKDSVLFPNIAQAHTCTSVARAVTATYKHIMYDLAKTERDGSGKAVKGAPVGGSSSLHVLKCNYILPNSGIVV